MLVVRPGTLRSLMEAIVSASHDLTDQNGERVAISTIDERALRGAALSSLISAVGDIVWPGDRAIDMPTPRPAPGAVHFRG